jgi:hypothetical protein
MEKYIGLLAGIVIGCAQAIYLINTVTRKIRPSVLSWLGWALLMGTTLVSQIVAKGWQWSLTGIVCSTIGCSAIAAVAFFIRNFSFRRTDFVFLIVGLVCVSIYLLSNDPWVTTVFAVVADAALAIPTVQKAIREPATERSPAWLLGVISSALALVICFHHDLIYVLFPGYLFLLNGGMVVLTRREGMEGKVNV